MKSGTEHCKSKSLELWSTLDLIYNLSTVGIKTCPSTMFMEGSQSHIRSFQNSWISAAKWRAQKLSLGGYKEPQTVKGPIIVHARAHTQINRQTHARMHTHTHTPQ